MDSVLTRGRRRSGRDGGCFVIHRGRSGVRLGCLLRFSFSRLNTVFAHRERSVDAVQLKVETASVANRFAFVVAPPESGGAGTAIRAAQTQTPGGCLKSASDIRTGSWFVVDGPRLKRDPRNDTVAFHHRLTSRLDGFISGLFIPFIL